MTVGSFIWKAKRRLRVNQKARIIAAQSKALHGRLAAIYREAIAEVLASVGIRKDDDDKVKAPSRQPFNVSTFTDKMLRTMRVASTEIYQRNIALPGVKGRILGAVSLDYATLSGGAVKEVQRQIQAGVIHQTGDRLAAQFVRSQARTFDRIAGHDANRIGRMVADLVAGDTTEGEFIDAMKSLSSSMTQNRAQSVARNLTSSAYSESRSEFWSEVLPNEAQKKEWYPSYGGEYDREHHNDIPSRGAVPFDEAFASYSPTLGLVHLRYPNDPNAPIEETINCACDYGILFE